MALGPLSQMKPMDVIGIVVILTCGVLIGCGANGYIHWLMGSTVVWLFGSHSGSEEK